MKSVAKCPEYTRIPEEGPLENLRVHSGSQKNEVLPSKQRNRYAFSTMTETLPGAPISHTHSASSSTFLPSFNAYTLGGNK